MKKKPKTPPPAPTPKDIDSYRDAVPPGCVLIRGSHMAQRAQALKIPFGLSRHQINKWTWVVDGIVILQTDQSRWETKPKDTP